ncbi:hypothetical protein NRY68_03640 [Acidithiobacillus ferrooxidans]|uniref:hypothetical protein n=1 Tax=Acidithiobacillus ferrooxidans TaxID=920 RepID=UPI002147BFD9|nr:hypothetical protein [Acidithiobacillus ferrooxidans]MCR1344910.1 hypothetical protein [Acidithiobacillus ferrooxidans]MCR1354024.1 hypothetical protein [Acidithiobacillus ferrooxidans]
MHLITLRGISEHGKEHIPRFGTHQWRVIEQHGRVHFSSSLGLWLLVVPYAAFAGGRKLGKWIHAVHDLNFRIHHD